MLFIVRLVRHTQKVWTKFGDSWILRQLVHVVTKLPLSCKFSRSCSHNIATIKTVPFAILCHVPGAFVYTKEHLGIRPYRILCILVQHLGIRCSGVCLFWYSNSGFRVQGFCLYRYSSWEFGVQGFCVYWYSSWEFGVEGFFLYL